LRGRLIFPFLVEFRQLDTSGTAADPDGAGPLSSGYDPDFKESALLPSSSGLGNAVRAELAAVRVPGQFKSTDEFLKLQAFLNGNGAPSSVGILLHFADLERLALVETATGLAKLRVGDRIAGIYDLTTGALVQQILTPPGLYVTQARPVFGLDSSRNLLEVRAESRDKGQVSVS
jgi:hypothetical protein